MTVRFGHGCSRRPLPRDPDPPWAGPLGGYVSEESTKHVDVPVQAYPSNIDVDEREQ